jgi:hypothetical protein
MARMSLSDTPSILVSEVGPRDGLQSVEPLDGMTRGAGLPRGSVPGVRHA